MPITTHRDFREAQKRIHGGKPGEGLGYLWSLMSQAHLSFEDTQEIVRLVQRAGHELGNASLTTAASLFLGDVESAERYAVNDSLDRAWVAKQKGDGLLAARFFEDAGYLAHAAVELMDAGDASRALLLWERLLENSDLRSEPYVYGLALYNLSLARAAAGDARAARRAAVQSLHELEHAADHYESVSERERAFDCFQVVMALGKDGAFENLSQGYLGSIRILTEDRLRHYVIQYYEDFQKIALERGEYHAAATLFRESATYARNNRLPYESHYREQAGRAHVSAAESLFSKGASHEMVENALVAAIECFNTLGRWSAIVEICGKLTQLKLGAKRLARYQRLQGRLAGMQDLHTKIVRVPDHLRVSVPYPEVWRSDVLEWEHRGDPASTMMSVGLNQEVPAFSRRRAQLVVLYQRASLVGRLQDTATSKELIIRLTQFLGDVEAWESLAPLEMLSGSDTPEIRKACLTAVRGLFFKRSFRIIRRGLEDPDRSVQSEAIEAVRVLHFPHAFEPLSRIFRHARRKPVLEASLSSIGRIATDDAVQFLIEVLAEGAEGLTPTAIELLIRSDAPSLDAILKREIDAASGDMRRTLSRVLQSR